MNVLMIGVDRTRKGGMWSVVENYLNDAEFCEKTNLTYIPTATLGSVPHRLMFSGRAFLSLRRALRKRNIDIVHIHMAEKGSTFRAGIAEMIAGRFGCKIIIHIHAEYKDWYSKSGKTAQRIIRNILNRADCLLILGHYWESFFKSVTEPSQKIEVLYSGVSLPPTNPYSGTAPNLLYFGVLNQQKGIFDLLNALKRIDREIPPAVKLAVCGADRDSEVRKAVEDLKLTGRVEMKGWIEAEQKQELFEQISINILPSYSEALPMSILETMAYGIPSIATDVAAIPEAIQNGENGILVKPGDVQGLAQAIRELVLNAEKRARFSKAGYFAVKENFTPEKHKKDLLRIYNEVLNSEIMNGIDLH